MINQIMTVDEIQQEFEQLPEDMKHDLTWWIGEFIRPSKRFNHRESSYRLKHLFEAVVHNYISNDQFKGAMLNAGYAPYAPEERNWCFRIQKVNLQSEIVNFYDWCVSEFSNQDSAGGDLARGMRTDGLFPRVANKSVILNYLRRRGTYEAAIDTFYRVWERYQDEVLNTIRA